MANNPVATMTARVQIDKRSVMDDFLKEIKDVQTAADGNAIVYKLKASKDSLKDVLKQIQASDLKLGVDIVIQAKSKDIKAQIESLMGGQEPTVEIGLDIDKNAGKKLDKKIANVTKQLDEAKKKLGQMSTTTSIESIKEEILAVDQEIADIEKKGQTASQEYIENIKYVLDLYKTLENIGGMLSNEEKNTYKMYKAALGSYKPESLVGDSEEIKKQEALVESLTATLEDLTAQKEKMSQVGTTGGTGGVADSVAKEGEKLEKAAEEMTEAAEKIDKAEQQIEESSTSGSSDKVAESAEETAEAASKEAESFKEAGDAAEKAAEQKEKFANANNEAAQSGEKTERQIEETTSFIEKENKAFKENIDLMQILHDLQGKGAVFNLGSAFNQGLSKEMALAQIDNMAPAIAAAYNEKFGAEFTSKQIANALKAQMKAEEAELQKALSELENKRIEVYKDVDESVFIDQIQQQKKMLAETEEIRAYNESLRADKAMQDAMNLANVNAEEEIARQKELKRIDEERIKLSKDWTAALKENEKFDANRTKEAETTAIKELDEWNQRATNSYKELTIVAQKYYELQVAREKGTISGSELEYLEKLESEWKEATKAAGKYQTATGSSGRTESDLINARNKFNESDVAIAMKFAQALSKSEEKLRTMASSGKYTTELSVDLEKVADEISAINGKPIDLKVDGTIKSLAKVQERIDKVLDNTKIADYKKAAETSIAKLNLKIEKFMQDNSAMGRKFREQFENLKLDWDAEYSYEEVQKISKAFIKLEADVEAARKTGKSFFDTLKERATGLNAQFLARYFSWEDWIRYTRELAQNVVEIDSALTELRKVSDASNERLQQSFEKSAKTAQELGSTISDVIGVTSDWARLGYNVDEAEELARVTTLFQTVGDNMTAEDTSSYLISTMQGFQLATDQAERIADKYNEVANNFAIDTAGIGEALKRSAASFNAANTDLSQAIALVTATNTVVQDPSSVGTLWKTLSARIRGAKTELVELGEEEDEFTQTTSKLQNLVKSLTGFDILEEDGKTFKSIYDIIIGIGKEWQNLTDIEQASLGEALAGKRNANALYAVLNNIETLEKAYKTAENSAGSAAKEQENYAKSVQYSIDRARASIQELSYDFLNSQFLKSFIEVGNTIIQIIDEIVEHTNALVDVFVLLGTILGIKFRKNIASFASDTIKYLSEIGAKAQLAGMASTEMSASMAGLTTLANKFGPLAAGVALVTAALILGAKAWDEYQTTVKEWGDKISETEGKVSSLKAEIAELQSIDFRTQDEQNRLDILKSELDYQERLLDVEKKRLAQQKYGNDSFAEAWDKDNANNVLREDEMKRGRAGLGTVHNASLLPMGYNSGVVLQAALDLEEYDKQLKTLDKDSEDYTKTLEKKEKVELKASDSLEQLYIDTADYQKKLKDAEEAQKSFIKGSNAWNNAQNIIDTYSAWISENEKAIKKFQKVTGTFDYSSIIESELSKTKYKGLESKLVDLAKQGKLTKEELEQYYGKDLVNALAPLEVSLDDIYNYILKISGLVDRKNFVQKVSDAMADIPTSKTSLSASSVINGVMRDVGKAAFESWVNSLSEEDVSLLVGMDVELSAYDSWDDVLDKYQDELNKAKGNPLKVDVEATITDSVEGINKRLKPQFDELGELYQSIFYGDNGKFSLKDVSNDQLMGIKQAFLDAEDENGNKIGVQYKGAAEAVNEFIDTLTSAETKSKSLAEQQRITQEAVNKLATKYFYAAGGLRELNEETADAIKQQFKQFGVTNIDEVVDGTLKRINDVQEAIENLDFDKLSKGAKEALKEETQKIEDWGLSDYKEDILSGAIQSKYGNVDMDNRTVIRYNEEIVDSFEEALKSWKEYDEETGEIIGSYYDTVSQAVREGYDLIDTVFGGASTFTLDNQEIDVAFTPIMVDENGNNPQFLSQGTVSNYIEKVLAQADQEVKASGEKYSQDAVIKRAFEIDLEGMNTEEIDSQGRVVGEKYVHGIIAAIGDNAIDVSGLLHFSGEEGAVQLAGDALEVYNGIKEKVAEGTLDVTNLTGEEIKVLKNEGVISAETAQYLAQLALQKQIANANELDTTQSVENLAALAQQAGIDIAELTVLSSLLNAISNRDKNQDAGLPTAYWDARIDELKGNLANEIQAALGDIQLGLNFAPAVKNAGKGGKDSADAYVEAYKKEKEQLQSERDAGLIDESTYLDKLKALIDKFFKDRAEYAKNYIDEMKEYLDGMKSLYDSAISGVTTIIQKKIDAANKGKDAAIKALNEEKEAAEERYQAEIDAIQEQMDALDDLIDKKNDEKEAIQDQIDKINEANAARDRSINLQKAEYELQRQMNQRTRLVYTGEPGQMVYERDESGVRDARENLKDAQDEIAIAALEKQIKLIEDEIELLEKQKDALGDQQKEIQKVMEASSKYYDKLIKEQEKYWDSLIEGLEKQKSKWEELAEVETIAKAYSAIKQVFGPLGYEVEDVINGSEAAFEDFKNKYIQLLSEMNKGNQPFLEGLDYAANNAKESFGEISSSAGDIETALGKVAEATAPLATASDNIKKVGDAASTASSQLSGLKDACPSECVDKLNNASFDGLTTALKGVKDAIEEINKALVGEEGSIESALTKLNNPETLASLATAFENLSDSIGLVSEALGVGGGSSKESGEEGSRGSGEGEGESGGSGLVSAIEDIKKAADEFIGASIEDENETVIGRFNLLKSVIQTMVTEVLGNEDNTETLIGAISSLSEITEEALSGDGGVIGKFEEFRETLAACSEVASILLMTIQAMGDIHLPTLEGGEGGAPTQEYTGTAKYNGDWRVGKNEKSLVGELGPELVLRNGKAITVGADGPEFVQLRKDDIVLNHLQSQAVLDKKNQIRALADGSVLSPIGLSETSEKLKGLVNGMLPSVGNIRDIISDQTKEIQRTIEGITKVSTNPNITITNPSFTVSGVTGEEVMRKIEGSFEGLMLNAYQKAMS